MWLRVLLLVALVVVLWRLFRFAMSLRFAKLSREEARRAEEARGRQVVAEIPLSDGVQFFVEEREAFHWGAHAVRKEAIVGARLLLNGGILGAASREGAILPPPPAPEEYEGRERWDVLLYLSDGLVRTIHCGTLREGVSREVAGAVFEAVRTSLG
jgi:hypothetical protein